ncbi:MAG: exonuclease domain-containing protein [Butyrivibrio sp.]|nr:exonuclease domain-containing protein [Butyrivibrio sp.]
MSDYIVLDLEWNQGGSVREQDIKELPFEIIEIGAVKLNEDMEKTDEFNCLVRPQVYKEMHRITEDLVHLSIEDLQEGKSFPEVAKDFLSWCGKDSIFCTWGTQDLTEFQRNMEYYHMKPLSDGPLAFYDVQKLYSLSFEDGRSRKSLEHAADEMHIKKNKAFHRALADAMYTAEIFRHVKQATLKNVSFDSFVTPKDKRQEIHIVFDNYAKYISREFDTKEALLGDPEVISTRCYLCHKNLRRKIKWFTPNGKHFYSVSYCDKHGFMKSKIRIKKAEDDKLYVVKTSKFITLQELEEIKEKQAKAKAHSKIQKALKLKKEKEESSKKK